MALFNYATRELSAKIVYYGPGLSGKTTNIEMVHRLMRPEQKGRLISLPTETDRTLFFDFLPLDLGQIKGFKVRFHLYTVPGQVYYNATRRLVLQGVDGVVFVADSQADMAQSNVESLKNLVENLATYGKKLDDLPDGILPPPEDAPHAGGIGGARGDRGAGGCKDRGILPPAGSGGPRRDLRHRGDPGNPGNASRRGDAGFPADRCFRAERNRDSPRRAAGGPGAGRA